MELEHKSFPIEFKTVDASQGIVEAIVAVFNNVDLGGDVIRYGAFDESASHKLPKVVWSHDITQPVAKTLETYPIPAGDMRLPSAISTLGGQYVKGQFNLDTQRGREAFSDIKFGAISEFSIGYWPIAPNTLADGTRELVKVDWLEWSPVLAGMNELTQMVSAKGKTADDAPFSDDLDTVADAVREAQRIVQRTKARDELRRKEGRMLSSANMDRLQSICDSMGECASMLSDLLSAAAPMSDAGKANTLRQAKALLTKQMPMTPEVTAIIEAIDMLLDALLGEPEETEPKAATRIRPTDVLAMRIKIAQHIAAIG